MANAAQSTCFKEIHHDLYGVYSPDNRNSLEQIATRIDAISYVVIRNGGSSKTFSRREKSDQIIASKNYFDNDR